MTTTNKPITFYSSQKLEELCEAMMDKEPNWDGIFVRLRKLPSFEKITQFSQFIQFLTEIHLGMIVEETSFGRVGVNHQPVLRVSEPRVITMTETGGWLLQNRSLPLNNEYDRIITVDEVPIVLGISMEYRHKSLTGYRKVHGMLNRLREALDISQLGYAPFLTTGSYSERVREAKNTTDLESRRLYMDGAIPVRLYSDRRTIINDIKKEVRERLPSSIPMIERFQTIGH